MKNLAISASWPLRRPVLASGILLALSVIGNLKAAPPAPTGSLDLLTGYVGAEEGVYSLHSAPGSQTNNAFKVGTQGVFSLDAGYSLQFDAGYSRISPGGGLPGSNEYSLDTHLTYKIDDIPVGAFLGYDKNGPSTFGGGIEGTLPTKLGWIPKDLSPAGDPLLNWQGFYARTHGQRLNHLGGLAEMRVYPCDDSRVSLHLGYQHTSSSFGGFNFSDNIWDVGVSAGYLFPCGWLLQGGYEHTHFNRSGLGVEGFTLGAHYCFGKKAKIRDTEVPYLDFSHMLGVQAKF